MDAMRALLLIACLTLPAQQPGFNYDEAKVPAYTLPDPLVMADGTPVKDAATWRKKRRPEILELFAEQVYGQTPKAKIKLRTEVLEIDKTAHNGLATRKQVRVWFGPNADAPAMDLLIYLPNNIKGRVPAFLGLNFNGNHTVQPDNDIRVTKSWVRTKGNVATDKDRGEGASRWPVDMILKRGYAVVTAYYGDIDPDFDDGFKNGVHTLFPRSAKPNEWGTIGAWAWGLSRAMDVLEKEKEIDSSKVVLHGHSRIGKAALWAGAQDERFAIVISNDSGEGGAALARRNYGETIAHLTAPTRYAYQFAQNYSKYAQDPGASPIDAHMLISLIAPRPLLLQTGTTDKWSDPKGEYLAALAAAPVYKLLGQTALAAKDVPRAGETVMTTLGYHMHAGGHGMVPADWDVFLKFMKAYLR
jgi:hypothetical protein